MHRDSPEKPAAGRPGGSLAPLRLGDDGGEVQIVKMGAAEVPWCVLRGWLWGDHSAESLQCSGH